MAKYNPSDYPLSAAVQKTIGKSTDPDPEPFYGIYARRKTKEGQKTIHMDFYEPANPRSIPQQRNRYIFLQMNANWKYLTDPEKESYNEVAKKLPLYGFNLFAREFFSSTFFLLLESGALLLQESEGLIEL